jgi:hypothetical protein
MTCKHPHSPVKKKFSLQGKWWLLFSGMFTEFFWLISHLSVQQ